MLNILSLWMGEINLCGISKQIVPKETNDDIA
jgi:hypothetical protein